MKNENVSELSKPKIDWDLVIRRLRSFLLDEKELARAERLIEREAIWQKLPPEKAIEWAEIAQAMGKHELSIRILEWILQENPKFMPAWEAKTKLLEVLIAKSFSPSENEEKRLGEDFQGDGISLPFQELRLQKAYVENYMKIFRGREDCFARQWVDKERGVQGYAPVRRPLSEHDVMDHLKGRHTYGIYLLHLDDTVSLGVIDVDCHGDFLKGKITPEKRKLFKQEHAYLIRRLTEVSRSKGIPCFIEFSGGKGYHFWFSFEEPVPAGTVRKVLIPIAKTLERDLSCFKLEVFPKQDKASGKGFGNLVKLPLGVHRVTGKASFFLHAKDRDVESQLAWLLKAPRIPRSAVESLARDSGYSEALVSPKDEEWAKTYPELAALAGRCNVLGQIIYSCRSKKNISVREERVLLGTISFLRRSHLLIHSLLRNLPDYNPHLVDYKISRIRGSPIGCKTIHRLLGIVGDFCVFDESSGYSHPLLHLPEWKNEADGLVPVSERINNLQDALGFLKMAILAVERFLPKGDLKK